MDPGYTARDFLGACRSFAADLLVLVILLGLVTCTLVGFLKLLAWIVTV